MNTDFFYEPISEEEAQKARFQLFENGVYKAAIEHAESKTSSKGNPMCVILMRIWNANGDVKEIRDWLLTTPSMIWKLRHVCEAVGLLKEFDEKKFQPEMLIGKDVMVDLIIQKGKEISFEKLGNKAPGAKYNDQNRVNDYIASREDKGMKPLPLVEKEFDDIIPF